MANKDANRFKGVKSRKYPRQRVGYYKINLYPVDRLQDHIDTMNRLGWKVVSGLSQTDPTSSGLTTDNIMVIIFEKVDEVTG